MYSLLEMDGTEKCPRQIRNKIKRVSKYMNSKFIKLDILF